MKITFRSQWVRDDEKDDGRGWLFVDMMFPDPVYKTGYGDPLAVLTRTKAFRKEPTGKAYAVVVETIRGQLLDTLFAAQKKAWLSGKRQQK